MSSNYKLKNYFLKFQGSRFYLLLVIFFLIANISLLWIVRGPFLHAFELMGAAQGLFTLSSDNISRDFANLIRSAVYYQYWSPANSLLFSLIPGLITYYFPGLYWGALLHLALFASLAALTPRLLNISSLAFFCCLGASPAIISYSLVAHPYLFSPLFTHVLSLRYILHSRYHSYNDKDLLKDLVFFSLLAILSLQLYETAKTSAGLFLLAAISIKGISLERRVLWIILTVVYIFWQINLSAETTQNIISDLPHDPAAVIQGATNLFKAYFQNIYLDTPILLIGAIIALFHLRSLVLFWGGYLTGGLLLALILAAQSNAKFLIPHRVLLVSLTATLIISYSLTKTPTKPVFRTLMYILLLSGMLWSAYITSCFALNPEQNRSLPYVRANIDWQINRPLIRDSLRLKSFIQEVGGTHIFFYGFGVYTENSMDPSGFPERLLLSLGVKSFKENVMLFNDKKHHYYVFPLIFPELELSDRLQNRPGPIFIYFLNQYSQSWGDLKAKFFVNTQATEFPLELETFRVFRAPEFIPPNQH